jgi:predicted DNA-binding transcriptional regulator YafY
VLGFGSAARVLEPVDIAEAVVEELKRAAARYPK